MSIVSMLDTRSKWTAYVASLVEQIVFFTVISGLYFLLVRLIYVGLSQGFGALDIAELTSVSSYITAVPMWVLTLAVCGYMLLITLYWAPRRNETDNTEVAAFATLLLGVGIVLAVFHQAAVLEFVRTVWSTWTN